MQAENYLETNRLLWNSRVAAHMASDFYDMPAFLAGRSSLNETELRLLGDIRGKSLLHLQCHFGQDSLSLSRMGARVTGTDISDEAIQAARGLNEQLGLDARFICSDTYALPEVLGEEFDIVYTTYGVLGWLPDMKRWARVVARYLKPGGRLILVEFHPLVWVMDEKLERIKYPYFNAEPIIETVTNSYADRTEGEPMQEVGWNHSLADIIQSLLDTGLQLRRLEELPYAHYNVFPGMEEYAPGRWHLSDKPGMLPLMYAIVAEKSE